MPVIERRTRICLDGPAAEVGRNGQRLDAGDKLRFVVQCMRSACGLCWVAKHTVLSHELAEGQAELALTCERCREMHFLKIPLVNTLAPMPPRPRDVIEAAREFARKSRDAYAENLRPSLGVLPEPVILKMIQSHMDLVMDCYLTGAAEMWNRLNGRTEPEPWLDDYEHETRLATILRSKFFDRGDDDQMPAAVKAPDVAP